MGMTHWRYIMVFFLGVGSFAAPGCSEVTADLTDRACDDGECLTGYRCHPVLAKCVPELTIGCNNAGEVCPDTIEDGDKCPSPGSYVSCFGGDECEYGCRTCQENSTWSACDGCRLGRVESCASCADDCKLVIQNAVPTCNPSPTPHCDFTTCRITSVNVDGLRGNGCECTIANGGVDIPCDGIDQNCNGVDAQTTGEPENCAACGDDCTALPNVSTAECSATPACVILTCEPGFSNRDQVTSNGCETPCTPTDPDTDICDNVDNDCNGLVDDNVAEINVDCDSRHSSAPGVSTWQCASNGTCDVLTCDLGWFDVYTDPAAGCLECTPTGGPEDCDDIDDDCNGTVDDVEQTALDAECISELPGANEVDSWVCIAGGECAIGTCTTNNWDFDGEVSTGCETPCTPTGAEGPMNDATCSDTEDNDCDGCEDGLDPDCGPPWWDTEWQYRKPITLTAGAAAVPAGYSASASVGLDTLLTAGKILANGDDVRILYWDGSTWTELDRINESSLAAAPPDPPYWFSTQAAINATEADRDHWVYYGNPSAGSPPADPENVYLFWDDFEDADPLADWTTQGTIDPFWTIADAPVATPNRVTKALAAAPVTADDHFIIANGIDEGDIAFSAFWLLTDSASTVGQAVRASLSPSVSLLEATFASGNTWDIAEVTSSWCSHDGDSNGPVIADNTWLKVTVIVTGTNTKVLVDSTKALPASIDWYDLSAGSCSAPAATGSAAFRIFSIAASNAAYFDDVAVRRFVDPEPTGVCGTEQWLGCLTP